MIGSKYLSDVLDTNQFQRGKINLIEAPCGCGKTTCAKGKIADLATSRNKVLYLIDTTNGCTPLKEFLTLVDSSTSADRTRNCFRRMSGGLHRFP